MAYDGSNKSKQQKYKEELTVHWYHAYSSPNGPEKSTGNVRTFQCKCLQEIYASIPLLETFTVLNCTSSELLTYTLRGSILTTTA